MDERKSIKPNAKQLDGILELIKHSIPSVKNRIRYIRWLKKIKERKNVRSKN
jgi:hypothetical protein